MQQNICKYSHPYYNFVKKTDEIFSCYRESISTSSFCEFHDPSYLDETTKLLVAKLFENQVKEAISKNKELLCIGYILPAVSLEGKKFTQNVYFTECKLLENANFTNTEFVCNADFSKCEFRDNVSFTGAVFHSEVNFSQSIISGSIVTFQNVTYNGKANFKAVTFNNALFTMSKFKEVLFIGSVFNGHTNFWNSDFNENCDFNLATFKECVNFTPIQSDSHKIPLQTDSLDCIMSFNAIHHFSLQRFLRETSRILKNNGRLFVYTRLQDQNAKTIWGMHFPSFTKKENRLYELDDLKSAFEKDPNLNINSVKFFEHHRVYPLEKLVQQAKNHHYSTFKFYKKQEFRKALHKFVQNILNHYDDLDKITWKDQNALLVIKNVQK